MKSQNVLMGIQADVGGSLVVRLPNGEELTIICEDNTILVKVHGEFSGSEIIYTARHYVSESDGVDHWSDD